jgi:hypothetical protein
MIRAAPATKNEFNVEVQKRRENPQRLCASAFIYEGALHDFSAERR